jgi:hypothetical protein
LAENVESAERNNYYRSRFEDQRHLLRKAIEAMSAGDLTPALQVAVTIRVMIHETGRQKPLLKSLRPDYLDLPIRQRFEDPPKDVPPGVQVMTFYCPISAKITQADGKTIESLNTSLDDPQYKQSILGLWWESACMVLPGVGPVFRKNLIVDMADKEGAHVDPKISQGYQNILGNGFIRFKMNYEDAPINISRLVVGKCGVELLDCLEKNVPIPNVAPAIS